MIYMFLSNNPSSGDINSSNLPCLNQLFQKLFSEIQSECPTDWIQIRPDIFLGLIWVQTVCKSYQQTMLVGKELTITVRQCALLTY